MYSPLSCPQLTFPLRIARFSRSRLSGSGTNSTASCFRPRKGDLPPRSAAPTPESVKSAPAGHPSTDAEEARPQLFRPERRSEEHTSELQSRENLVCRLLLE